MTSIQKRSDGVFRARYRDAAGKEHARHFKLKKDAVRWLNEVTASVVTGMYVDPGAGRITFEAYAEQWRDSQVWRPNTADQAKTSLKRAYPLIGERPLDTLKPADIQGMVRRLSETLAPATIEVTYAYVASVLKNAATNRRIAKTPCDGIKLPEVVHEQVDPLTIRQVEAIRDALPDRFKAMVTLSAGTGMRFGEVTGLTIDRILFLKRFIKVDRQWSKAKNEKGNIVAGFGPPKTPSSNREIPLPDSVAVALSAHIKTYGIGVHDLVFVGERGAPLSRKNFARAWRRALSKVRAADADAIAKSKRSGGDYEPLNLPNDITFHDLRHHYASLLIFAGLDIKTVQANLGHKSAQETLDTYAHLWPNTEDRTRQAVDAALNPADSRRTNAQES